MRIAFVHASGIRNSRFIEERGKSLMQKGHEIAFIGWNRYHDPPYSFGKAHIRRFGMTTPLGSKTYFFLLIPWWAWTLCHLLRYRPQVAICVNADAVIPCLAYTWMTRTSLVHDLHDFYYYHFAYMPAPIPRIVDELTCAALTHARLVLTISMEAISDFFSRRPQCRDYHKVMEYPCLPTPAECEALKKAAPSRHDDFTACYFGNLAWDRGVLEILDAVLGMEGCRLLLAGPELEKGILSHCLAHAGGCTRIAYLGYLMREDLLAHTARCHCIVLLLMPDNRHHRIPVPNKLYEGIVCRTPVITTAGTESAAIVERFGMGVVIPENTPEALRKALLHLRDGEGVWESCVKGCEAAEQVLCSPYDFDRTVEAIEKAARAVPVWGAAPEE